jgi:hypothetical protein
MELYCVEMQESRWSFVTPICHRDCEVAFIADCDVITWYLVTHLPTYLLTYLLN